MPRPDESSGFLHVTGPEPVHRDASAVRVTRRPIGVPDSYLHLTVLFECTTLTLDGLGRRCLGSAAGRKAVTDLQFGCHRRAAQRAGRHLRHRPCCAGGPAGERARLRRVHPPLHSDGPGVAAHVPLPAEAIGRQLSWPSPRPLGTRHGKCLIHCRDAFRDPARRAKYSRIRTLSRDRRVTNAQHDVAGGHRKRAAGITMNTHEAYGHTKV